MNNFNSTNLIWLDLEMSGLNPDKDVILEIATIVTNASLDILAEGPVFAIHQSNNILDNMDSWCKEHHAKSGLTKRVKESKITEKEAEIKTLEFLKQFVPDNTSPMCGNSICQDRRFLWRFMPDLEAYFHYRNLDVSTIKILTQLWKPEIASGLTKKSDHIALEDIRDSINELRYYREHFFKS